MSRRVIALLSGGLAIAVVTGAGTAAAPGAGPPGPAVQARPELCQTGDGVTVGWVVGADITLVGAVAVGNLPEDCGRQMIRLTLRGAEGEHLAEATVRPTEPNSTVIIDLDEPVAASAITLVELVVAGTPPG
jgi:hypothetical protein